MINLMIVAAIFVFSPTVQAGTTLFQCAVNKVVPNGVRLNVVENNGVIRANLIFGTTVSGTIYGVQKSSRGYSGTIRNRPEFKLELAMSTQKTINSNIDGYSAHLRAVYPTINSPSGYGLISTELVCGKKISNRWN